MAWEYPWIKTETFALQRTQEELIKRGKGDRTVEFKIPLHWVEVFDVFTDFLLQDPFAVEAQGGGETSHYYFVENITYDFMKETLAITAIDLQWILGQFCILGDEDVIKENWSEATGKDVKDRMYCYLCDEITGQFPDGEEGKMLMSEE